MKRRLLTVQGPLQYITGQIACHWNTAPSQAVEDTLLLYDFLAEPAIEDQIAEAVLALSRSAPWARIVFIRGAEMDALMRDRYPQSIKRLRALVGIEDFDEIYLARDHVGHGSPLLLNAYVSAKKISYGDSFGLVGQRESLETPLSIKSRLRAGLRRMLLGAPEAIPFDAAILSLPIDMSGRYLATIDMSVPSRSHVVAGVERVYDAVPALRTYCRSLCEAGEPGRSYLYLLSNLTASGLSDAQRETALYAEVIRETSPIGSFVYLKPHPRSTFEVLNAVVDQIKVDYRVRVVDDDRFARMPVELWVDLVRHCEVVAMFSTSAINLKYLFDKEVVMPLTEDRISRHIAPTGVAFMTSACLMMREALANLETWDRKSALWSPVR